MSRERVNCPGSWVRCPGVAPLLALTALLMAAPGESGQTAPALGLTRADATLGEAGILLRVVADYPHEDLLQHEIDIHLLVRETTTGIGFLRISLLGGAERGELQDLAAAGLTAETVQGVLDAPGAGSAVRITHLDGQSVELLLPPGFPEGPAEAQLFMLYRGEPLLSNPVAVTFAF